MAPQTFQSSLKVTHIGTATALIELDGLTILTDPFFSPEGTEWPISPDPPLVLKNTYQPPLGLQDLPPIDLVLLSHEDHPDNLDEVGRQLLDGRRVFTTPDGASKLAPRPGVRGLKQWEKVRTAIGGREYEITATPCEHLPGGECTGFVLSAAHFGSTEGKPNAVYFSGDTVYLEELGKIKESYHVSVALLNLGKATAFGKQITMDGVQGGKLAKEIGADVVIPMHYEGWGHFAEGREGAEKGLEAEGVRDKVRWLKPGVAEKLF